MIKYRRSWMTISAKIILVILVCSCSDSKLVNDTMQPATIIPSDENPIPVTRIPIPPGDHYSALWFPDGKIVVMTNLERKPFHFFVQEEESWHELNLKADPSCTIFTEYFVPAALPDGRLGLMKRCSIQGAADYLQGERQENLVAYDWEKHEINLLVDETIPDIGGGSFSWNPEMTKGVQSGLPGVLFGTIYWLTPQQTEPMTITIEADNKSWSLDENYGVESPALNSDAGIARSPSWSPDGQQIAFFASPSSVGRNGPSRLQGEYQLFLMDIDTLQPEPVLEGIYFANGLQWSPDNRWLVFYGEMGQPRQSGVWIFSPETNVLKLVDHGHVNSASWSPDGQSLLIIRECLDACLEQALKANNRLLVLENGEVVEFPKPCTEVSCPAITPIREIFIYDVSQLLKIDDVSR